MGIFVTDAVEEEAKIEKQGNPKPTIGPPAPEMMSKEEFREYCFANGCIGAFYERYPESRPHEQERER